MFNSVSMTGVGALITLGELAFKMFGIELPDGQLATAVNGIITTVGIFWLVWGHIRGRKDLKAGLIRK